MSRNYKKINALYWKAVSMENTNPIEAKKLYEMVEDMEMKSKNSLKQAVIN